MSGFVAYDWDELNSWTDWLDSRGISYNVNEIDDPDDDLYRKAVAYLNIDLDESLKEGKDCADCDESLNKGYYTDDDEIIDTADDNAVAKFKLTQDGSDIFIKVIPLTNLSDQQKKSIIRKLRSQYKDKFGYPAHVSLEEGKDCANCDESCSKDEKLNEGKTKITVYPVVCIDSMAPSGSGAEYVKYFKTMEAAKAWKEAHPDKAAFQYGIFPEEIVIEDGEDVDESCSKNEGLNEALNNISLDTDDQHLDISADETGRISVVSEPTGAPAEDIPDTTVPGEDSIVPLDNNDKENIEANISPDEQEDIIDNAETPEEEAPVEEAPAEEEATEEAPAEEGEDMDFELEAESFNYLGNTFAKKLYENVASYKMTESKHAGNDFIVEGTIKFNSGNEKPTSFVFTEGYETKTGRLVLEGANKTFFPTKAFKLRGKLVEGKLVCESLRYNYSINKLNESTGKQEPVAVRGIVRGK